MHDLSASSPLKSILPRKLLINNSSLSSSVLVHCLSQSTREIFLSKNEAVKKEPILNNEDNYNSNIIKDVNYLSKDERGNEYILDAAEGQIDLSNNKIIFLTNVKAIINLIDSRNISISSDFGKYNIDNYDTIFSKNVLINHMNHKISGDYLDFSLERNSMIISKNVVYTNGKNTLKTDVIEINIQTKDTKIFMYEDSKKVNIKTKN